MKISQVQGNKYINNKIGANIKTNKNFKGLADGAFNLLDKGFSILDKNPMIQVSFVDTVSTNIPRTLVDLKTGLAAALETCRREFSGLFVNCLMPGLVVLGFASVLPKGKELKNTGVATSWANGAAIDRFKEVYKQAQTSGAEDTTKEYVKGVIASLSGLDGTNRVHFKDKSNLPEYKEAIENITSAIGAKGKTRKNLLKEAQKKLVGITKTESVLQFDGKPQANLEETLRDVADLGSKFNIVKKKALANIGENTKDSVSSISTSIDSYASSLTKFVNKKSLIGLAAVIAIAVSVQRINRSITRKQFKAEGAPIYKDFGKKDTTQKMDEKQKKEFFAKKVVSAIGMYGLAAISMMKKPSWGMFQFSGIFPTMDQCRWIAASTFASRMMGAEDENELRESTVRDLASFSGLYFLGDYVKKGVASGIEKLSKTKNGAKLVGKNVVLLNRKKVIEKPILEQGASLGKKVVTELGYRAKQFGNWIKNTDLKTAAEVSSTQVRNLRNLCRVADIAFSVCMLGILLPKYNRRVTEKKVAAAKLAEEQQKQLSYSFLNEKNTPEIFKNILKK